MEVECVILPEPDLSHAEPGVHRQLLDTAARQHDLDGDVWQVLQSMTNAVALVRLQPARLRGAADPLDLVVARRGGASTSDEAARFGTHLRPIERTVFARRALRLAVFRGRQGELFQPLHQRREILTWCHRDAHARQYGKRSLAGRGLLLRREAGRALGIREIEHALAQLGDVSQHEIERRVPVDGFRDAMADIAVLQVGQLARYGCRHQIGVVGAADEPRSDDDRVRRQAEAVHIGVVREQHAEGSCGRRAGGAKLLRDDGELLLDHGGLP